MDQFLVRYFSQEKLAGLFAAALGIGALTLSTFLWRTSYRGAVIPLGLIALLQLGIGGTLYLRTDRQVADLQVLFEKDLKAYQAAEQPRMEKVMRSFILVEVIEVVLILAGLALALLCKHREALFAAGLGLLWQSAVMLIFDLLAERRAQQYLDAVAQLSTTG